MSDTWSYQLRILLRKAAEESIELGAELLKMSNKKISQKNYNKIISEFKDVSERINHIIQHYESK